MTGRSVLLRALWIVSIVAWARASRSQEQVDIGADRGQHDPDAIREKPRAKRGANLLGVHLAQDLALVGGTEVCSPASQAKAGFVCFEHGTDQPYLGQPLPGASDEIATGVALATTRLLLSYDRAVAANLTLGARLGYAAGGGPAPFGGASFLPVHAELRGSYWFGAALRTQHFRPYVHVGGGVAQVDAKLEVTIIDCSTDANGVPLTIGDAAEMDCLTGARQPPDVGFEKRLDAYKKLGRMFATAGGGAVFLVDESFGLELNLNLMAMLQSPGFVVEPSLGLVYEL